MGLTHVILSLPHVWQRAQAPTTRADHSERRVQTSATRAELSYLFAPGR